VSLLSHLSIDHSDQIAMWHAGWAWHFYHST